jgi:hypothetical protein
MLLGGHQLTFKSHLVFTALFCFAPFSVFSSRMSAPYCYRLHVPCDLLCDLLCHLLCDLVRATAAATDTESHTKSHLRFAAKKRVRKWFLWDSKSQIHQIASAISSKSHMKSHSKSLRGRLHLPFGCAVWCGFHRRMRFQCHLQCWKLKLDIENACDGKTHIHTAHSKRKCNRPLSGK